MSACEEFELLVHGLVDGELDAANAAACEKHLAGCTSCSAIRDAIERLRRQLHAAAPIFVAGTRLRANVDAALEHQSHLSGRYASRTTARFGKFRKATWPAIALAMAASLAVTVLLRPAAEIHENLTGDIVAAHLRSLQADHLLDVATSDRHTVKPWFAGKIEFSPPVVDLADRGFELAGGRIDYFQNHAAAALAYRRRAHVINLFIWPDGTENRGTAALAANGFNLVHWQKDGLAYWGISDLNSDELRAFQSEYLARAGN